jgi:hypothetical protein
MDEIIKNFEKTVDKILFFLIATGAILVLGFIFDWETLQAILTFFGILYGTIALIVFLKWVFIKKF